MIRFRPPVRRQGDAFVVDLGDDERALLGRLLDELRELLATAPGRDDAGDETGADAGVIPGEGTDHPLLTRLFPPAHLDDPEQEAEYQRLMRDELIASRLAAIANVQAALDGGGRLDEESLTAFMQSINAVRLVLGTMLGVSDDPSIDEVDEEAEDSPEYHLYGYLSWLLDWTVRALSS